VALGDGQSGVVQEQVLLTAYRLGRDNFLFANLKSRRAWRALITTCMASSDPDLSALSLPKPAKGPPKRRSLDPSDPIG